MDIQDKSQLNFPTTKSDRLLPGPGVLLSRALVHLAEHGGTGGRYFIANNEPIRMNEFAKTFARLANRPLRVLHLPAAATRLAFGPTQFGYPQRDAVLSNIRLRGLGFRFEFPTLDRGVRQVLGSLHE